MGQQNPQGAPIAAFILVKKLGILPSEVHHGTGHPPPTDLPAFGNPTLESPMHQYGRALQPQRAAQGQRWKTTANAELGQKTLAIRDLSETISVGKLTRLLQESENALRSLERALSLGVGQAFAKLNLNLKEEKWAYLNLDGLTPLPSQTTDAVRKRSYHTFSECVCRAAASDAKAMFGGAHGSLRVYQTGDHITTAFNWVKPTAQAVCHTMAEGCRLIKLKRAACAHTHTHI